MEKNSAGGVYYAVFSFFTALLLVMWSMLRDRAGEIDPDHLWLATWVIPLVWTGFAIRMLPYRAPWYAGVMVIFFFVPALSKIVNAFFIGMWSLPMLEEKVYAGLAIGIFFTVVHAGNLRAAKVVCAVAASLTCITVVLYALHGKYFDAVWYLMVAMGFFILRYKEGSRWFVRPNHVEKP